MTKSLSLLSLLIIGMGSTLFAQEDKEEMKEDQRIDVGFEDGDFRVKVETRDSIPANTKDTTIINTKRKTIYIISDVTTGDFDSLYTCCDEPSKGDFTHWAGIDLGVNGYLTSDNDIDLGDANEHLEVDYGRSRSISINPFEYKARLIGDHVGLTTGLGLQYNSYRLKNDYTLLSDNDTIVAFQDSSINLKKNKLRTTWLNVPLMLEFNTHKDSDKSIHLAAGVVGGLHLGSMYKQKYSNDGSDVKAKNKSGFQVAPYKLEAMVRVGYGSFNLFASYQLTELFEEGHGPELYPFTLGVTVVAFD